MKKIWPWFTDERPSGLQFVWWLPRVRWDSDQAELCFYLPFLHFGRRKLPSWWVDIYKWAFWIGPLEIRRWS